MAERLGPDARLRIDPNARWKTATAIRIGKEIAKLPMEYYEDPVAGQAAMAEVRRATGLKMSTNMCVTRFEDIPEAMRLQPIDVLLCDHHYFGGFAGCQALGPIGRAAGWTLSQHSNNHAGITMAAMVHLAASIPELTLASDTHYPWLDRGHRHHRGAQARDPGRRDGGADRAGARHRARSRQAGPGPRGLQEMRDAPPRRPRADAAARAGLDRRAILGCAAPSDTIATIGSIESQEDLSPRTQRSREITPRGKRPSRDPSVLCTGRDLRNPDLSSLFSVVSVPLW